ncbi:DUF5335 family protein [Rhizobium sp. RAF56]|uniref:DUF5335 family protein n=1 Tax=Rhizobium sp. RAF56 TaxID=3233062 RepID=UPI003F97CA1F
MTVITIAKTEWPVFFSRLRVAVHGKKMTIEIVGASLGDQILVKSSPLEGATYEPRNDTLEISIAAMTHVVEKPEQISVQIDHGEIIAIEVAEPGDRRQILTFA